MSPPSSSVWTFFKKIDPRSCSCNLCGKTYKTSGNTTNLATHLKSKHLHAYLKTSGKKALVATSSLVDTTNSDVEKEDLTMENVDTASIKSSTSDYDSLLSPSTSRKQQTLASCLGNISSFDEGGTRNVHITQSLIYMICKDNLPFSCVEKQGLQRFTKVAVPLYKLPSRFKVTQLVEQRYDTLKAIVKNEMQKLNYISLTSDILTITNSTRSFLVLTGHYQSGGVIEAITLSAKMLVQAHTANYIKEEFEEVANDFNIPKEKIISITTDGGTNMIAAARLFIGENRIPCMAHLLNLVVDGALKDSTTFVQIADHIKSIVTYFKHSVIAMDDLRKEQMSSGKKEGEVLTLIQSVSTRWNSCLDMLERFELLSGIVAKILSNRNNNGRVPDMVATSQLNIVREIITLLKPFKQSTEEISGHYYVTASLAVPLANLLKHELEQSEVTTFVAREIQNKLLKEVEERLIPLEKNRFLGKATLLDPRFKRLYFSSPVAVSNAIMEISEEIRDEYKKRGKSSPNKPQTQQSPKPNTGSIWERHSYIINQASTAHFTPEKSSIPTELKQYLDQPNVKKEEDPMKFWIACQNFTPILSGIALKYLIPPASSVSSERVASAVNLVVPDNRSRLTGEHIKARVFLTTISDKFWFS